MEATVATQHNQMVYCRACGKQMHVSATACPNCGAVPSGPRGNTTRRILPAVLLLIFVGWLGAHRFYVGKVGTAILFIITLGGLGLWYLIDLIMLLVGSFTDKDGHQLVLWT